MYPDRDKRGILWRETERGGKTLAMETVEVRNMQNEDSESLEVVVAEHLKQLQKKQKFEFAAQALTSIVQERYADATPAEQNAIYGAVCRAATLLTIRFTGTAFGCLVFCFLNLLQLL